MRNSGVFFVIRLSFTWRTKNSVWLLFDFSKGVPAGARGLRLLTYRFSTRIRGSSLPFPLLHTLPQSLSHTCSTSNKILFLREQFIERIEIKNKWTNNPSEEKRNAGGGPVAWHMGYIRGRGLTPSVWGVWIESDPYIFCIHLSSSNSYQLSITDTRLPTVVDKKLVLSTVV